MDRGPNSVYWHSKPGAEYRQQQQTRSASGQQAYTQQERWIEEYFFRRANQLGRRIRILDFGCGFGRFALLMVNAPHIDYYGFDFSPTMVAPLIEQDESEILTNRIRVADRLEQVFGDDYFDVIFTVSVLIHNPPHEVRSLLQEFAQHLNSDGEIILVENKIVSLSLKENNWHGGCWVHDFAGITDPEWDLTIYSGVIDTHDIYMLRRCAEEPRHIQLAIGDSDPRSITLDELRIHGLLRLQQAIDSLGSELSQNAAVAGTQHDLEENHHDLSSFAGELMSIWRELCASLDLAVSVEPAQLQSTAHAILRRIESAQTENQSLRARLRAFEEMQSLRQRLSEVLLQTSLEIQRTVAPPEHLSITASTATARQDVSGEFSWNEELDTIYAHDDKRFTHVCHVFHRNWFGIRSAAGYLPGNKLAIDSQHPLSLKSIETVLALLRRHAVARLIIHGMSEPMYSLLAALRKDGMDRFYLVSHGTTAQWAYDDERKYALMSIKLVHDGVVRRFGSVKRGYEPIVGKRCYTPQLLNLPPKLLPQTRGPRRSRNAVVLAPSWNNIQKNLAGNVLAAASSDYVSEVWVTDENLKLPTWLTRKLRTTGHLARSQLLSFMTNVDCVLDVTSIDCHPMVDLEALATGTPSLSGPLFLDALENHPYTALTTLSNPLSIPDIKARLEKVLDFPATELLDMMADYSEQLRQISLDRYAEFAEL